MATFLLLVCSLAAHADMLFDRLAGDWVGSGARVQLVSGRKTRIEMQVSSRVEADRLFTRNLVRETNDKGEQRGYERRYWIRAAGPGRYELGSGEDKVFSHATFDGERLDVLQNLGGTPPYLVRSETRFPSQDSTSYEETLTAGEKTLSVTKISFRPAR